MNPNKKISFGFSKSTKKPSFIQTQPSTEKQIELVECLEGQSIKIKDAVEEKFEEPLIIPIKDNKRNLLNTRILHSREATAKLQTDKKLDDTDCRPDSELTIDELAAKELINDARKRLTSQKGSDNKIYVLPMKAEELDLDGEKEPTLEDYENVPISDYGFAMLRGMGWKGLGIGKNPARSVAGAGAPELRPKGLGLGANKLVKSETPKESLCDKDGNILILKKGAFAKVIAGCHKGKYCQVQGLDDESGRIIVRTSLSGEILSLNEFLLIPITEEEYGRDSKVLNKVKYKEYKEKTVKSEYRGRSNDSRSEGHSDNEKKQNDSRYKSDDKYVSHSSTSVKTIKSESKENKSTSSDEDFQSDHNEVRKKHKRKDKKSRRDRSRSPPRREKSKSKHRYSSSESDNYEKRNKTRSKEKRKSGKNK